MRPSGTEKIGGGSRFENKLDFIVDRGEYPELSLPLWRLSVGHAALEAALTGLCCHW